MTIRIRLTLWYTIIILLLLAAAFALTYYTVRKTLLEQSIANIIRDATIVADEVEVNDGRIRFDLDDDELETITGGTIYALYSFDNRWLDGRRLDSIDKYERIFDELRVVIFNQEKWFIYDKVAYDDGVALGWARVLMPLSPIKESLNTILITASIIVIPFIILAAGGGLLIAGMALKPIKEITTTARRIGRGELETRIKDIKYNDEVGKLAQTINKMAERVEAAFNREKQFTSDISHEMRTPLAVIITHSEDALRRNNLEEYKNSMQVILEKSLHMQEIFSKVLTLARGYEEATIINFEPVDISALISDICDEAQVYAADAQIEIIKDLENDIIINVEQLMFTSMIMNLLENSIKYGKTNGFVRVGLKREAESISIAVEDNGQGISDEDLPHIFKRFYRSDKSRSTKGTGLGLLFVRYAVKLHKGTITVETALGKGTKFLINLPELL